MIRRATTRTDEGYPDTAAREAPDVAPSVGLWARIERSLAANDLSEMASHAVDRYESGVWRTLAPGVRMKRLWDKRTLLIACEPGAVVPGHRHRAFEHSLVLSGDVSGDEGDYAAGDYQGMPAGSDHGAWTTRNGCRVLIQYDS
jgi:anti-sigma factor ChrR (cupin superfamily)